MAGHSVGRAMAPAVLMKLAGADNSHVPIFLMRLKCNSRLRRGRPRLFDLTAPLIDPVP